MSVAFECQNGYGLSRNGYGNESKWLQFHPSNASGQKGTLANFSWGFVAAPGRPGFQSSQTWLPYVSGSSADPEKGPKRLWNDNFKNARFSTFLNVPNSLSQLAAKPYRRPARAVYGSSSFPGAFVAPGNGPKRMGPRRIQWIAKTPFINMNFRRRRNLRRKTRPSRTGAPEAPLPPATGGIEATETTHAFWAM